jgi:hypothetical protein
MIVGAMRAATVIGLTAGLLVYGLATGQDKVHHVIVYDGTPPTGQDLALIAKSPVAVESPRYASDTVFIPRSANGHFYTHGFLTGSLSPSWSTAGQVR